MLSGLTFGNKKDLEKEFKAEADREKARKREEKKQRKKEKKDSKKQKNKHKKDRRKHDSSSEGSSGPEDAWQQQQQHSPGSPGSSGGAAAAAAAAADKPALQREDWMTVPMARSFAGQPAGQQQEQPKPKEPEEPDVVAGIRYMKPEQAAAAAEREEARRKAAEAAAGSGGPSGPTPASAGVSWRMKAVARAQQLAKEQGRGLNEVLSERWGSAAEIAKGIMDNAAAEQQRPDHRHHHQQQQQQRGGDAPVPHYLSGVRSERASMMKPPSLSAAGAGASKLSWRRPAAAGGGSGSSSAREGGRDAGREQQQQQQQRDREQQGHERDRQRDRDADRDMDRGSDRGGDRERDRQHDRGSDRGSERDRARDHDRDRDRDREGDRDRHGSRGDRDRDRGQEARREPGREVGYIGGDRRGQDRRDEGGRGGSRGDWQGGRWQQEAKQQPKEVVEALKAVAGSINTFSNDGSFMQQFQQQTQPHEQQQQQQQRQRQRSSSPDGGMEQNGHHHQQQMDVDVQDGGQAAQQHVPSGGSAAAATGGAADNRSKADLLRAKLGGKPGAGNRSAADALRARLGGKAPEAPAAAVAEVVHLPLVDAAGRAAPGAFGRETAADTQRALEAAAGGRVAKRVQRYGADGTRERYFADDDSTDLQTLVKRAKHGDDGMDIDRAMMTNIAKNQRFKETDIDPDAEYDFDAGIDLSDSRRRKGDVQQQAARERQRQVAQFNRLQKQEDKCTACFKSPGRNQDLTIAVGQSSYLSLMPRGKLVEGHCCILTQEHTASMRQVDDDTWSEVRNWQKCLINMFLAQGRHVIFMETAMAVGTHRHHALMEAIPVDETVIAKAPMYFKKAMEEAESEWSQHAAKAAISTRDKGLRGSVPPNFPYLYVQFGPSNGYVHVIDDEAKFDKNLGRQVLVGLLKLPAEVMHRRAAALDAGTVKREAAAFRKQFSPFF